MLLNFLTHYVLFINDCLENDHVVHCKFISIAQTLVAQKFGQLR